MLIFIMREYDFCLNGDLAGLFGFDGLMELINQINPFNPPKSPFRQLLFLPRRTRRNDTTNTKQHKEILRVSLCLRVFVVQFL